MAYYQQQGGYPQQQQGYYPQQGGYAQQGGGYAQHDAYYGQGQHDPYAQDDPFAHPGYPPSQQGGGGYPPQDPHAYMRERRDTDQSAYSDPFVGSKEKLPREDGGFVGDPSPRGAGGVNRGSVAAMMAAAGEIPRKEGLRMWRHDEHDGEFLRGGKKRTCGRCCCCTAVVLLLIVIGVVAGFLLWVRPPNVAFNGVEPPNAPLQEFASQEGGFLINFNLDVSVNNPNFFGASFEKVTAKAFSPANKSVLLGTGEQDDITIGSHSNNTIHFPFTINYTTAADPGYTVLISLATSCGFIGGVQSPITIDYSLTVKVKVVFTISPTFSKSTSLDCPIDKNSLVSMLEQSGSSASELGPLAALLGLGSRSLDEPQPRAIAAAPHNPAPFVRTRRREWGWIPVLG